MEQEHNHDHMHVTNATNLPPAHPKLRDYGPLFIVFAVIVLGTVAVCANIGFTVAHVLGYLMGFFFLIFGLFKVLDLAMFAMGYREYDLIAKVLPPWGAAYPLVELVLGGAYLAGLNVPWINILTLVLSLEVVVSVGLKLAKHEVIQCVCLGNILKVPLTYVSLIEYAAMGAMAVWMLLV